MHFINKKEVKETSQAVLLKYLTHRTSLFEVLLMF